MYSTLHPRSVHVYPSVKNLHSVPFSTFICRRTQNIVLHILCHVLESRHCLFVVRYFRTVQTSSLLLFVSTCSLVTFILESCHRWFLCLYVKQDSFIYQHFHVSRQVRSCCPPCCNTKTVLFIVCVCLSSCYLILYSMCL